MNRRDFIKGTAAVATVAALPSMAERTVIMTATMAHELGVRGIWYDVNTDTVRVSADALNRMAREILMRGEWMTTRYIGCSVYEFLPKERGQ